jgi:hypothetical protein
MLGLYNDFAQQMFPNSALASNIKSSSSKKSLSTMINVFSLRMSFPKKEKLSAALILTLSPSHSI